MDRRSFFRNIGVTTGAVAIAPSILAQAIDSGAIKEDKSVINENAGYIYLGNQKVYAIRRAMLDMYREPMECKFTLEGEILIIDRLDLDKNLELVCAISGNVFECEGMITSMSTSDGMSYDIEFCPLGAVILRE